MTSSTVNIAIGLLVLAWIVYNQVRRRQLSGRTRLGPILAVLGLIEAWSFVQHHHVTHGDLALTALSVVIGLGLAALRAYTVRIWQEGGTVWQQGGWLTALLWVVGLGQHLLVDSRVAPGLGEASLLLYFGIVIFVQRLVVLARARARGLEPAGASRR